MSDSPDIAAGRMTSKTTDGDEGEGLDNNVEGSDLADASDLGGVSFLLQKSIILYTIFCLC